jgi:hypothetical protein
VTDALLARNIERRELQRARSLRRLGEQRRVVPDEDVALERFLFGRTDRI